MSNILKDIYQSYGYKENEVFKPVKIGCSMADIEILDKLVKNAPASADTFAEIANLMAEQQNSIAKNTSDISTEVQRAKDSEAKIETNVSALSDEMTKSDNLISQNVQTILNYIKSENTTGETKINGKVNVTSEDDVTVYGIYKNDTAAETKIAGKSVTVKNVNAENTRLDIVGSGKTTIDTIVLNGDYPKASSNAQISVNNGDGNDVEIKNSTINQTSYNGIEIGLGSDSLPKNVVIDGIDFEGKLSNNAILVFGLKDNGTLTIKNCHFESMSNCVRFSNKANATGITINIENCTVGNWDSDPTWAGFLLFEDYTSKNAEETEKNNLFGDDKITVNLDNVICMGKKITNDNLKLGEQTADTFAYVYDDKVGYIKYPENINRYPKFTCK